MMLCNDHCSFSATEDVAALSPLWHQVWFISGFQLRLHGRRHEPIIGDAGNPRQGGNRVSGLQDRQQAQVNESPWRPEKETSTPAPLQSSCGRKIVATLYPGQWRYHAVSNSAWLLVMGSWTSRFFPEKDGMG